MEDLYLMMKASLVIMVIVALVGVCLVLNDEIKQKEDVINEIREYCERNVEYTDRLNDILEIIDKENK